MFEPRFHQSRPFLWYATLLVICAAAFFVTALISQGIFERVPHVEDEAAYLFQAQVFAQGRLKVPTPPYPTSYWSPFVLDVQGYRFGKYPPGYPLVLTLGVLAGEPWIVNALLASFSLWFLACAGRIVYSPTAGLLAAALGLTAPVFLAMSGTLLSHPASFFFTSAFLWAYASLIRSDSAWPGSPVPGRNGESPIQAASAKLAVPSAEASDQLGAVQLSADRYHWGYAILAGLALGCLLITRPFDAIGVSLPFALYILVQALCGDRVLFRHGIIIAAVVVFFGLLLLAYWYNLAGSLGNPYTLLWPYDRPGFGPDFGVAGYTLATGLRHARYNLRDLATGFLGWPGYLNLLFLSLPFVFRPRDRWNYLLLAGVLSLVALHVTYWYYGGRDAGFPRYYYAGLPMLLLLTARGVELAGIALRRPFVRARFPVARAGTKPNRKFTNLPIASLPIYLVLIALVLYNVLVFLPPNLNAFRGKSGITSAPLRIVQEAGVTNAIVFVPDVEHWYDFAVFFAANSPTLDSSVVYVTYNNQTQARAVRRLFAGRECYLQSQKHLRPCPF